jgi:hypothetical protein
MRHMRYPVAPAGLRSIFVTPARLGADARPSPASGSSRSRILGWMWLSARKLRMAPTVRCGAQSGEVGEEAGESEREVIEELLVSGPPPSNS